MQKIAAFIVKKRKLLLVVMLALAVVCAALMPFVGINTDMTKYLPDSSQMKIGMDRMNEAFPDVAETYTIRVMFRGLDARDKLAIREQLAEIPNVDSVAYEPDSDDYNRGDATLYKLTTQYDYKSDEEAQIERDVADRFADYDVAVRSDDTSTPDIPPIVFILSIVLVTTILLIACPSYFEPVLFLLTIGVAVLLNQGTNIILGETSDVTASISAILQLALSMDYSIILMNRYRQELQADPDPETASAFIEMAAHLVEMKSFLLLPRSEEGERMKQELTGQLIEYDQCRRMAALLRAKGEAAPVFVRRPMEMELDNTYALHHAPQMLADYWQALAGRTKTRRVPTQQQFEPLVTAPMVSVTSRVVYILRRMLGGTVAKMEQLFSRSQSRSTNVATFLALLELVRGGRIGLDDRGELTMRRTRPERNKENP